MDSQHIADISRVIQLAVAPVFLLTAVGTLITAMNNRLSRVIDRRRVLLERKRKGEDVEGTDLELGVLSRRVKLIYYAMLFAVMAALSVCVVVAGGVRRRTVRRRSGAGGRDLLHRRDGRADLLPEPVHARSIPRGHGRQATQAGALLARPQCRSRPRMPTPAALFALIVFGLIGTGALMYGKRMEQWKSMTIGGVLLVFPYFVSQTWLIWGDRQRAVRGAVLLSRLGGTQKTAKAGARPRSLTPLIRRAA
jgi:hypothetical protein